MPQVSTEPSPWMAAMHARPTLSASATQRQRLVVPQLDPLGDNAAVRVDQAAFHLQRLLRTRLDVSEAIDRRLQRHSSATQQAHMDCNGHGDCLKHSNFLKVNALKGLVETL